MALCTLQPGSSILPPAFCHPAPKFVFYQMRLIGKEKVGGSSGRGAIKRPSPLLRIQVLLHNFGGSVPMDGRSMSWIYRLIALLCCLWALFPRLLIACALFLNQASHLCLALPFDCEFFGPCRWLENAKLENGDRMRLLANIANASDCKRLKRFWVLETRRYFNVTFIFYFCV